MTHSTTPPKQPSATNRTLVDGVAFIRIDDTNAPNARVAIHVEHPSHDRGVRCFFRRADGDVAASIRSHLRTSLPDDLTRVEITDTVGLGISEADVLPRRMARETPTSSRTPSAPSTGCLVSDGGTTVADCDERMMRLGGCDGCGAFGVVTYEPGLIDRGLGWACRYCVGEASLLPSDYKSGEGE